jgi:Flp pilus assembly protein CpaB
MMALNADNPERRVHRSNEAPVQRATINNEWQCSPTVPELRGVVVRRSNLLVIAGIAFFVVGVVIVALLSRDSGSTSKAAGTVDALFAKDDIPAGTNGDDAIPNVEVRRVNASDRQPDALSTPSQLSNQIFTLKFSKGEQIRSGGLKVRSISPSVQVPAGKEAVAIDVPFVAGGAGYLAPGDLVNVYQVIPAQVAATGAGTANLASTTPRTQLLLTNVKVIDVQQQVAALSGATPATNQTGIVSRPAGTADHLTVLLALDAIDAEKVIFGSSTTGINLYLTRVGDKAAPAGPTPGRDYSNILGEEPQVANTRDH